MMFPFWADEESRVKVCGWTVVRASGSRSATVGIDSDGGDGGGDGVVDVERKVGPRGVVDDEVLFVVEPGRRSE
jgi:hypothetical protein